MKEYQYFANCSYGRRKKLCKQYRDEKPSQLYQVSMLLVQVADFLKKKCTQKQEIVVKLIIYFKAVSWNREKVLLNKENFFLLFFFFTDKAELTPLFFIKITTEVFPSAFNTWDTSFTYFQHSSFLYEEARKHFPLKLLVEAYSFHKQKSLILKAVA